VSVAFAANGLVHFWEHRTAWYLEWEDLADGIMTGAGRYEADGTERPGEEEQARLAGELADAIVADPEFRAARVTDRWNLSGKVIPAGTDSSVGWDARRQACTRASQLARERYDQLEDQIDDLAAELLASPAYQQAISAAARKKAAATPGRRTDRSVIPAESRCEDAPLLGGGPKGAFSTRLRPSIHRTVEVPEVRARRFRSVGGEPL
jgi:hypothetical protein